MRKAVEQIDRQPTWRTSAQIRAALLETSAIAQQRGAARQLSPARRRANGEIAVI
jgi:hypothetical protein